MSAEGLTRDAVAPAGGWLGTTVRTTGLVIGLVALAAVGLMSVRYGSHPVSTADAWNALFHYDATNYEQIVVRTLRLSRTVVALLVGCGLAVAGGVMQGVTRNPLADPYLLGVSGGAALGITTAVYFGHRGGPAAYVWFAFGGALLAAVLVYVLGSGGKGGGSSVRLVLAGVITALATDTWASVMIYTDGRTRRSVGYLVSEHLVGRALDEYWVTFPFIVGGALACVFLGHQLNVLNLGEDAARAVGMNTGRMRVVCSALAILTTAGTVALAGPIGFVGFAVPHLVRFVTGPDYRWILAYCAMYGGAVLLAADIIGRLVLPNGELPAGLVMTAVAGPFFVLVARRGGMGTA